MQTDDQDKAANDDGILTYLHQAYDELDLSPPEQLLFDAHLIGAMAYHVPADEFAAAVDMAVGWTRRERTRRL